MRPFWFLFFAVLTVGAVGVVLAESVEAQEVACQSEGTCQGHAFARTEGVNGHRRWCFTTALTCGPNAGSDGHQAAWDLTAGGCATVFYLGTTGGLVPPQVPNTVTLAVYYGSGTGTLVRTVHSGTPPSFGTSYSVCATSDGTSSGSPRSGTYRLFVQATRTSVPTPYQANSDGTAADDSQWARGALRGGMVVSSLTASTPTGGLFAYGPSGNEQVTVTASHSTIQADQNIELARTLVSLNGPVIENGASVDLDSTSLAQGFTIDDTFQAGAVEYDIGFQITGNAPLTGLPWTVFQSSGHGTGVVVSTSTLVTRLDQFTADPRVHVEAFSCDLDLLNRAESLDCDISALNARLEAITKAVRFNVFDNDNVLRSTQDLSGDPKNLVYSIGASDGAGATPGGSQWTYTVAPVDTYDLAAAPLVFVSSLYLCDVHPQLEETLSKDDFPSQDANENFTYFLGADNIYVFGHVEGIRNDGTEIDTTGNAVSFVLVRPSGSDFAQLLTDTQADGWTLAWAETPSPPAGVWTLEMTAAFNGNSCMDEEMLEYVSSFTENLVLRLLFNTTATPGDVVQIFVRTEVDDEAAIPDGVPVLKVSWVNTTQFPYVWEDVLELSPMLSVVTWTPEVNGSLYVYNWTVPHAGAFNVWTRAPIQAAPIRESSNLLTVESGIIEITTALDTYIPFLFWGGLALFFLTRKAFAPAVASTIMVVSSLLLQSVWSFALGVLIVMLTVWIHVMAKRGVFQGVDERE